MKYLGFEIKSVFNGLGKRVCDDNFKGKWEILFPKYKIMINDVEFEYSSSAVDLGKLLGIDKQECIYIHDSELYVSQGYSKRRPIKKLQENYYTSTIANLKNEYDLTKHIFNKAVEKVELSDESLKFALRCIIQDAYVVHECADIGDFADCYGYTDIKETLKIWNACSETNSKLKLSGNKLEEILEKLSEDGIE